MCISTELCHENSMIGSQNGPLILSLCFGAKHTTSILGLFNGSQFVVFCIEIPYHVMLLEYCITIQFECCCDCYIGRNFSTNWLPVNKIQDQPRYSCNLPGLYPKCTCVVKTKVHYFESLSGTLRNNETYQNNLNFGYNHGLHNRLYRFTKILKLPAWIAVIYLCMRV